MVSLKATVALLGLVNMAVFAAPVAEAADAGTLVAQASIFMCKDTRWNGECQNVLVNLNTCSEFHPLASPIKSHSPSILTLLGRTANVPDGWNDQISSIRNDSRSNYRCTWYLLVLHPRLRLPLRVQELLINRFRNINCSGKSYANQDDANLADGNGQFNDSISSYSCKQK